MESRFDTGPGPWLPQSRRPCTALTWTDALCDETITLSCRAIRLWGSEAIASSDPRSIVAVGMFPYHNKLNWPVGGLPIVPGRLRLA
jgi:hypothetical protein